MVGATSSADDTRSPAAPNDSASPTRSGLVNLVPARCPNLRLWWSSITPYAESVQTMLTVASPSRLAVSSSCMFIRKPPSPEMVTTRWRAGSTSRAATAAGTANPIAAAPFEISTVFGS